MADSVGEPISYPFCQSHGTDIDPEYARLRRDQPLARVTMPHGGCAWLVTRYADVRKVLSDRRFSRAATLGKDVPRLVPLVQHVTSILTMDPPEHTRHRKLVSGAFTPRRINELAPRIEEIAIELLDELTAKGPPADLVVGYTRPLPVAVICELLGVPFEDRQLFYLWAEAMRSTGSDAIMKMRAAGQLPWEYLRNRIALERKNPSDSVLGTLVRARDEDDRLSEDELVSFAVTLLLAGHETTTDELGGSLFTLLRRPDDADNLRACPELIAPAVEELLRFVPIGTLSGFTRIATEDVEMSGGVIRAGEAVVVQADSANHDDAVFSDPNMLRLDRAPGSTHLAFGYGPHHCLGAQLARTELRIAIGTVLRKLPGLALATPADQVPWKSHRSSLGPRQLTVTW